MCGYGPLRSYLVMDLQTYLETGTPVFRLTRHVRIFPGVYELPVVQASAMSHSLQAVSALFQRQKQAAKEFLALSGEEKSWIWDRGYGKCCICGKWIPYGARITCPPCNGKKGNHRSNRTCE